MKYTKILEEKMDDFSALINSYVILEQTNKQNFYCMINKVEEKKLYLMLTRDFEKAGLVADDEVKCRIEKNESEINFKAKIIGVDITANSIKLVITPTTKIEQYLNVRGEKRIGLRFIAFTDENNLVSVVNISRSGMLFSTKIPYMLGDKVIIKLLISYPSAVCNFIGEIIRVIDTVEGKKEYGIKISQYKTDEDEKAYKKFITEIVRASEFNKEL